MAYKRKPNYHFLTEMDLGINKVPNGRMIIVENFNNRIRCFLKISDWNLNNNSTIVEAVINGSLGEIQLKIGSEIEVDSSLLSKLKNINIAENNILVVK